MLLRRLLRGGGHIVEQASFWFMHVNDRESLSVLAQNEQDIYAS